MVSKDPAQFVVGDVIDPKFADTPYSGSPIIKVEGMGDGRTQVHFKNGELVEFFNGVQHEIQE